MNNLDKDYLALCQDILDNGTKKKTRTGTDAISVFGRQIRHKMSDGFPLLTTKKMAWKTIVAELLWFLKGSTDIRDLWKDGCHIWDGDAWANYKRKTLDKFMNDTTIAGYAITSKEEFINKIKTDDEFAKKWGELGPIYGKQWRNWGEHYSNWEKFDGGIVPDDVELNNFVHKGLMTRKKIKGIDQIANLIRDLKTNPDSRRLMVSAWNVADLPVTYYRTDDELYQDYLRQNS